MSCRKRVCLWTRSTLFGEPRDATQFARSASRGLSLCRWLLRLWRRLPRVRRLAWLMGSRASALRNAVLENVASPRAIAEPEPLSVIISTFNLGIVKWPGKKDGPGAVAAWKNSLETNSAGPEKDAVSHLMAQAQQR